MTTGPVQRVLATGTAHVQLELQETTARLLLHGQVDRHSLDQLHELVAHITDSSGVDDVRLRLSAITLGPAGAAELRTALELIDSRLRRSGARLRVSCAEPLPAAAVPESLRQAT